MPMSGNEIKPQKWKFKMFEKIKKRGFQVATH